MKPFIVDLEAQTVDLDRTRFEEEEKGDQEKQVLTWAEGFLSELGFESMVEVNRVEVSGTSGKSWFALRVSDLGVHGTVEALRLISGGNMVDLRRRCREAIESLDHQCRAKRVV